MLPILQIGPLALQFPGLLVLVGMWVGLSLAEKHSARRGIAPNDLYNLVFIALIAGVIGARLSYLVQYPAAFASSPLSLLSPNPGLLDAFGGLAVGLLAGLVFSQRKALALLPTLDALTPLLAVALIAIALAQLAGGSAFGAPADLPWSIELWGARRHPTQLYTAGLAAITLALLWPGNTRIQTWTPGRYFLTFTAATAAMRLFTEAFRGDSVLLPGGLRLAQVAAWVVLALSLWGLSRLKPAAQPAAVAETPAAES